MDDEHVYLDKVSREDCLEHITKVVRRDGLQNYFRAMTGMWLEEYGEFVESKAAGRGLIEVPQRNKMPQMRANLDFDDGSTPEHLKNASESLQKQLREFEEKMRLLSESAKKPSDGQSTLDLSK